jgi:transposase
MKHSRDWINEGVSHVDVAHRIGVSIATLYNLKRGFMSSSEKMQEYKQRYEAQQSQLKGKSYE